MEPAGDDELLALLDNPETAVADGWMHDLGLFSSFEPLKAYDPTEAVLEGDVLVLEKALFGPGAGEIKPKPPFVYPNSLLGWIDNTKKGKPTGCLLKDRLQFYKDMGKALQSSIEVIDIPAATKAALLARMTVLMTAIEKRMTDVVPKFGATLTSFLVKHGLSPDAPTYTLETSGKDKLWVYDVPSGTGSYRNNKPILMRFTPAVEPAAPIVYLQCFKSIVVKTFPVRGRPWSRDEYKFFKTCVNDPWGYYKADDVPTLGQNTWAQWPFFSFQGSVSGLPGLWYIDIPGYSAGIGAKMRTDGVSHLKRVDDFRTYVIELTEPWRQLGFLRWRVRYDITAGTALARFGTSSVKLFDVHWVDTKLQDTCYEDCMKSLTTSMPPLVRRRRRR